MLAGETLECLDDDGVATEVRWVAPVRLVCVIPDFRASDGAMDDAVAVSMDRPRTGVPLFDAIALADGRLFIDCASTTESSPRV